MKLLHKIFPGIAQAMFACVLGAGAVQAAERPAQIARFDLQGQSAALRVTGDGKFLAAQTADAEGSKEVQIFDLSDLHHPRLYTRVPVGAGGTMALGEDGKSMLIVTQVEAPSDKPGKYLVTAYDAHDPLHPVRSWQHVVASGGLTLAPDASAYAYLGAAAGKFDQSGLIVVKTDAPADKIEMPEALYVTGEFLLSEHGNFVASGLFNFFDLRGEAPILYRQGGNRGFLPQDAPVALFDDGTLLLCDMRFGSLGLFAASKDIPRIARLDDKSKNAVSWSGCPRLIARAGKTLLLNDGGGWVRQIELQSRHRPELTKTWYLPGLDARDAIDSLGHIYSTEASNGGSTVVVRDFARSETVPADWAALEAAWHAALAIHRDKKPDESERRWNALRKFEEAAPSLAIDAPVTGVSNKTAAAILNDYAFLLLDNRSGQRDLIKLALRRAIVLDPARTPAYLNLADAIVEDLPQLSDWDAKQAAMAEAAAGYRQYLMLGGKSTAAIESFLRLVDSPPDENICDAVAHYANAGYLKVLISRAATGVSMEGKKVDLWFTDEGSAHVPVIYAFDSNTDVPIDLQSLQGWNDLSGRDALGLVAYRNAKHVLYYRDVHHPVESKAASGGQRCVFKATTVEKVGPKLLEPQLCKRLLDNRGPESIELQGNASISEEEVTNEYGWTRISGAGQLDIANDGHPAMLGSFDLASGAGAGCEEQFFDVLTPDGSKFASGALRDRVMAWQHAIPGSRNPLTCGNHPRLFAYAGKIYFEDRSETLPPIDDWHQFHWVTRITGGKVEDVCSFRFSTTISVQKTSGAKQ